MIMKKRMKRDWRAVVMIGMVALVVILAFLVTGEQEGHSGTYRQQSAQPALPVTVRQGEYRGPQPRETELLLYPNPVRNTLHVVMPQKYASYVWLVIYSSNGRLLKKYAIESGRIIEIDVQNFPMGDYIVKVGDRQGRTWSAKFFKA